MSLEVEPYYGGEEFAKFLNKLSGDRLIMGGAGADDLVDGADDLVGAADDVGINVVDDKADAPPANNTTIGDDDDDDDVAVEDNRVADNNIMDQTINCKVINRREDMEDVDDNVSLSDDHQTFGGGGSDEESILI